MIRSQRRSVIRMLRIFISCGVILLIFKLIVGNFKNETQILPTGQELRTFLQDAEFENHQRLQTVERVCRKHNLGIYKNNDVEIKTIKHPPTPQYSVFYIDRFHNLSYCPIYKAGSTTWLYNLCLLWNFTENQLNDGKQQISTIARKVIPELEFPEAEDALQVTKKLLVTRHPFERLLSAYRDKLENSVAGREHGTLHFYRKYGAKIVREYRDENYHPPYSNQTIKRENIPQPAGIEPTWREFVQYLIHTDLTNYADDHWIPYYLYCTPCWLKYDIIAKVESLWRDQLYTINEFNLNKTLKPNWRHNRGDENTSKIYFSQLNKNMVEKLYDKFSLDFELFDYSPDKYYEYAVSE